MQRYNFYVPTMTQAMRGKEALSAAGIRAFVSRNTDMHAGAGCSYSISVLENGIRAEQVLQKNQIRITRKEQK